MDDYTLGYFLLCAAVFIAIVEVAAILTERRRYSRYLKESSGFSSAEADVLQDELLDGELSPEEFEERKRDLEERAA